MTVVFYEDKAWSIIHDYGNGMVEIREVNGYRTELVNKKDVEILIASEDAK